MTWSDLVRDPSVAHYWVLPGATIAALICLILTVRSLLRGEYQEDLWVGFLVVASMTAAALTFFDAEPPNTSWLLVTVLFVGSTVLAFAVRPSPERIADHRERAEWSDWS